MMVLFGFIFIVNVSAVLLVQSLDVECAKPQKPRKVIKAQAPASYQAGSSAGPAHAQRA